MPTNENNAIVVSVTPIQYAPFYHAFDLIGNAVSDSIYFITPAYGLVKLLTYISKKATIFIRDNYYYP